MTQVIDVKTIICTAHLHLVFGQDMCQVMSLTTILWTDISPSLSKNMLVTTLTSC
jgi:hypothetical protein